MSYTYKDNSKEVLARMEKAHRTGLKAIGIEVERAAKRYETAVDTGLLRNSITFAISGEGTNTTAYKADKGPGSGSYQGTAPREKDLAVYVGTNVEYAPYIELGARNRAPLHFLKRAATENNEKYKSFMEDAMKNA